MISKFKIDGVGSLAGLATDKALKSCVLIHGENGSGKSTLAAVIRSCNSGDATIVSDRQAVGRDEAIEIDVITDGGTFSFADGKWSAAMQKAWVFDQAFVNKNVHSGDTMNNDHGKSLYSVILGESCGDLLEKAAKLETQVDAQNKKQRGLTKELESHVLRGLTLEQFLALEESSTLEDDIRRQEENLDSLRKRKKLQRADTFQKIELAELTESFQQVLSKTISNFMDDAEKQVYEHLENKTKKASLSWLEQGCDFANDADCPFCGSSLSGNDLIQAYKGFFSREYNTLKAEINSLDGMIESAYGERVVVNQQKVLSENKSAKQFWEDFVEVPRLDESIFEEIGDEIGRTREKLEDLVTRKKQNPLDDVEMTVDLKFGSSLQERIDDYNTLSQVANERIEELRTSQAEGDVDAEQHKLLALQATADRFKPAVVDLIEEWKQATKEKERLSKKRKDLQKSIEKETKDVFASRGELINELLDSFGAGFRLGEFDTNNRTKPPSVQIRVCFNGAESVRLDDKASKSERPFDAALSAGERNMLAFAFFMTNLSKDKELADKVVVIDDPITNLDERRLARTAEIAGELGDMAQQLIVLSHNDGFLDMIGDKLKQDVQKFQLCKSEDGTSLVAK